MKKEDRDRYDRGLSFVKETDPHRLTPNESNSSDTIDEIIESLNSDTPVILFENDAFWYDGIALYRPIFYGTQYSASMDLLIHLMILKHRIIFIIRLLQES